MVASAAIGLLSLLIVAAPAGSAPKPIPVENKSTPPMIDLKLATSLPEVGPFENFAISGTIENNSSETIYIHPKWLSLVLPPELDVCAPGSWYAYLAATGPERFKDPTKPFDQETNPLIEDHNDKWLAIPPGEKNAAMWVPTGIDTGRYCAPDLRTWRMPITIMMRSIFFRPGDYHVKIAGAFWTDPTLVGTANGTHSITYDATVTIVAPQSAIILGAMLGGLFGFFLVARPKNPSAPLFQGIITSLLLSIIVTILLSRLAQSQFVLKITVNDFWGAMAIGFVSAAYGNSILDEFIKRQRVTGKDAGKKDTTQKPSDVVTDQSEPVH